MTSIARTLAVGLVYCLIAPAVRMRFGVRGLVVLLLLVIVGLALPVFARVQSVVQLAFAMPLFLGPLAPTWVIWRLSNRPKPPTYFSQVALGSAAFLLLVFLSIVLALWSVWGTYRG